MSQTIDSYPAQMQQRLQDKQRIVEVASGRQKAELVLKNGTFVNVFTNELQTADIAICSGQIVGIGSYCGERELDMTGKIICPGFIDAHIHLESCLVTPPQFARAVLPHGTTTVITDPHEITNVMGTDGIAYMFQATEGLPIDVRFMLPSCVPATPLDEAGAALDYREIDPFYSYPRVQGLAEMMNYVGAVNSDSDVLSKIVAAQAHQKIIDGHAPGLSGKELDAYIAAGVYSDHECSTLEDAMAKLARGQFIMIRDGTAAHNLEALAPLLTPKYYERCMFCTDDKHPSDLLEKGHMDDIIHEAITKYGVDPIIAVKCATCHPARYFHLNDRGAIAPGYLADLVVIDNFEQFHVEMVFRCGTPSYMHGSVQDFPEPSITDDLNDRAHHTFHLDPLTAADFSASGSRGLIGMVSGQIVTTDNGFADHIDPTQDILKIAVIERHKNTRHIGIGYLQGYGLKQGAVATSISHDSHNIIVIGASDEEMAAAANRVLANCGGITVLDGEAITGEVILEIAGLMSEKPLTEVNTALEAAKNAAYRQGVSTDIDPFMTLSFMALPVIPTLRLTTKGIIDVNTQQYI